MRSFRASGTLPAIAPPAPGADDLSPGAVCVDELEVKRSGRTVLSRMSFALQEGTVTALLGPSGCGKTTLIRSILGSQHVTAGTVSLLGRPAGSPELRRSIGYVTQAPSIYLDLTVLENLTFFARVLSARPDIEHCIEAVGLGAERDHVVGRLSGGQRSRVSLAVALLGTPPVMLLDEPTVGLDPILRRELWATFKDLAGTGTTLLISSHVMDEAEQCDRVLLLREGSLMADTTPGALRSAGGGTIEDAFVTLIEGRSR